MLHLGWESLGGSPLGSVFAPISQFVKALEAEAGKEHASGRRTGLGFPWGRDITGTEEAGRLYVSKFFILL